MSSLRIYHHNDMANLLFGSHNNVSIRRELAAVGIGFEQWRTPQDLTPGLAPDEVIAAFQDEIKQLATQGQPQSVDVISVHKDDPSQQDARHALLNEYTNQDDLIHFFVAGEGLFGLHIDDKVYEVHCHKGDLLRIPANTPHWFDMGETPALISIRLFSRPQGHQPDYTGNSISQRFNRLDN